MAYQQVMFPMNILMVMLMQEESLNFLMKPAAVDADGELADGTDGDYYNIDS